MPGFVDIHTHGLGKFDTRTSDPEMILEFSSLQHENGTEMLLPTLYPAPIKTMRARMKAISEAMRQDKAIIGMNLEGPFLNPLRAGALDRNSFLKPTLSDLKKILDGFEGEVRVITIAPELPGALRLIEYCAENNIRVSMGHSDATFKKALDGKKAGASGITHLFNAMRGIHHREPGLAGLGLLDPDLFIEIIPDGVHISPEVVGMIFRLKNPDRIILVSDSVKGPVGKPVRKKGILMGGGSPISRCKGVLENIGIDRALINKAGRLNPLAYLGLN